MRPRERVEEGYPNARHVPFCSVAVRAPRCSVVSDAQGLTVKTEVFFVDRADTGEHEVSSNDGVAYGNEHIPTPPHKALPHCSLFLVSLG